MSATQRTAGRLATTSRHLWRGPTLMCAIACCVSHLVTVGREPYRAWALIKRLQEIGPMNMIDGRFEPTLWALLITAVVLAAFGLGLPSRLAPIAVLPGAAVAGISWRLEQGLDDEALLHATSWLPAVTVLATSSAVLAATTGLTMRLAVAVDTPRRAR